MKLDLTAWRTTLDRVTFVRNDDQVRRVHGAFAGASGRANETIRVEAHRDVAFARPHQTSFPKTSSYVANRASELCLVNHGSIMTASLGGHRDLADELDLCFGRDFVVCHDWQLRKISLGELS